MSFVRMLTPGRSSRSRSRHASSQADPGPSNWSTANGASGPSSSSSPSASLTSSPVLSGLTPITESTLDPLQARSSRSRSRPNRTSRQRHRDKDKDPKSQNLNGNSNSSNTQAVPTLHLHVPSYASVYLAYHPLPLPGEEPQPRSDGELTGELEIRVPASAAAREGVGTSDADADANADLLSRDGFEGDIGLANRMSGAGPSEARGRESGRGKGKGKGRAGVGEGGTSGASTKRGIKVKSIRLVLRTYLRMNTVVGGKKGKRPAERVIFERTLEYPGGEEGIFLEEGTQRFQFTMIIPSNLAPHNWVGGDGITASVTHYLYGVLEGLPEDPPSLSHSQGVSGSTTPTGTGSTSFFGKSRVRSFSPFGSSSRHRSGTRTPSSHPISGEASRSPSPSPHAHAYQARIAEGPGPDSRSLEAALLAATRSMSMSGSEPRGRDSTDSEVMPRTPTYDQSQADEADARARRANSRDVVGGSSDEQNKANEWDVEGEEGITWLRGTHWARRSVEVIYNPNPGGGVNQLDERISSSAPDLGEYHLRMTAEEWHVAGWPLFRFSLPDPAPTVTIFAFKYSLSQNVTIIPPPLDPKLDSGGEEFPSKPVSFTTVFPFVERGEKPPRRVGHPGPEWPALWRGTQAGGRDCQAYSIEAKGRLPKDDVMRPSTLPGLITPIEITHVLTTEMFFSIWGETDTGEKMAIPGPGGLRVMRVTRPVVVPSCGLIPQELNLPNYEDTSETGPTGPCKLCKKYPHEKLCTTCPVSIIPHLRHDLDPQLIGDKTGKCPLCAGKSFLPTGKSEWDSCACGLAKGHTEERMRAFVREMEAEMWDGNEVGIGDEGSTGWGGRGGSRPGSRVRSKEGEERGRRMARD